MIRFRHLLPALACLVPHVCAGQSASAAERSACDQFLGLWSGTWSQGYYGTQRIHVTHVSDQCIATLAYSPTEAMPQSARAVPINAGVMAFGCNVPGGVCRLEVKDGELRFTYIDPSGFVNRGVFHKENL